MYMASCYWPPAPIDTPLSTPWADNITTFADALLSRMPDLPADMLPATIPIVERCWCDFSAGFFEPFNATRWEVQSVEHLKRQLEPKLLEMRGPEEAPSMRYESETSLVVSATAVPGSTTNTQHDSRSNGLTSTVKAWLSYFSYPPFMPSETEVPQNSSHAQEEPAALHSQPSQAQDEAAPSHSQPPQPLSPLRKEYDLRPYGFDMVVDFSF